jgi:hypothetical protein
VFTKEELLREVWGFRAMGRTRTLDSHASRLRRKLAAFTDTPYVLNEWGVIGISAKVGHWETELTLGGGGMYVKRSRTPVGLVPPTEVVTVTSTVPIPDGATALIVESSTML